MKKTSKSRQTWPTKKAFIQDHLHVPIQDLIELGKRHGITLSKAIIYTARYEAAKRGENVEIVSQAKTTMTMVRTESTTLTKTTLVGPQAEVLDAILGELLDEAITIGDVKARIATVVRARIGVLARAKIETMVRDSAKEEIKAYFNDF